MSEDEPQARLDFKSPEEFRLTCHQLAMRLHYLNRVAMGECGFTWQVAETLERLGATFEEQRDDPTVQALYGDGYTPGKLGREELAAGLHALMYPDKDDT
ncbi:hypothetical protein [Sulfitobacter aestuariivivens]|uniref:Uncharacterized protein n=1 Tax=Sulfitobacter aestuariivivens TaxID=2766981 RepID=A0A927D5T1_9RHOB|nr:hypothetical protein [Sulfitobacter aestuariivivens]MBD3663992.1 hypothetical protein [Sulfitobacter aestuariivivens]